MPTLADACGPAVAFTYRSLDRLILNAYIPTLQMPGAMVTFLREVCGKPILSPVVFKALTDRFVAAVHGFTRAHRIPVLRATGRTKPGAAAQRALRAAARAQRWGVVAVVVHQESARVFTSRHAGGRRTNFWVHEERRLVNHYYFYLRDREYGDGFVRISSYPPFSARIWLNAHGHLAAQLRRRRIDFRTLDNCVVDVADPAALATIAQQFEVRLVEQIARRWLAWVPDPLTTAERAAERSAQRQPERHHARSAEGGAGHDDGKKSTHDGHGIHLILDVSSRSLGRPHRRGIRTHTAAVDPRPVLLVDERRGSYVEGGARGASGATGCGRSAGEGGPAPRASASGTARSPGQAESTASGALDEAGAAGGGTA